MWGQASNYSNEDRTSAWLKTAEIVCWLFEYEHSLLEILTVCKAKQQRGPDILLLLFISSTLFSWCVLSYMSSWLFNDSVHSPLDHAGLDHKEGSPKMDYTVFHQTPDTTLYHIPFFFILNFKLHPVNLWKRHNKWNLETMKHRG